ncbi:MAG: hypothetical protein ACRENG_29180, partial [bacterium]
SLACGTAWRGARAGFFYFEQLGLNSKMLPALTGGRAGMTCYLEDNASGNLKSPRRLVWKF